MNRSAFTMRTVAPAVVALAASLAVFGAVAEEVGEREWQRWDSATALLSGNRPLRPLMAFWSLIGGGAPLLLISALLIAFLVTWGKRAEAIFIAASVVGGSLLSHGLKAHFDRPRPPVTTYAFHSSVAGLVIGLCIAAILAWPTRWKRTFLISAAIFVVLVGVDRLFINGVLGTRANLDSFPSGHAISSTSLAVAAAVVAWRSRFRWVAVVAGSIFALEVGTSRVYLGFHYPSDVLAGWCLALAWVTVLAVAFSPWRSRPRPEPPEISGALCRRTA